VNVGQEHYDAIRSDSNSENWAFFAYDYPTKTQVNCTGSGSGDINEFFDHVKNQNGGYGFCRVETGDEESRRAKFFLLAWVPESGEHKLPIMVKGNMSVHKASFKEIFRDFNSEFTFSNEDDLNADAVLQTIIKAGGANYMGQQN
jgi:hypothetical protein